MQYRDFGTLDWQVSALGFGAMRLPTLDKKFFSKEIDEPRATQMLRYAIDYGVNYVDTAYVYHDDASEGFLGKALQDGYRERVKLATKLSPWLVKTKEDLDRVFEEQLERLQTEYIDCYLLHFLKKRFWEKFLELDVLTWMERQKAAGRIRHIGFSFHDEYEVFQEIVDGYDHWEFCQIQYNYMDEEFQAGRRGLRYAAEKGLAVIVMEPLRGGGLAQNIPQPVQTLWDTTSRNWTPAEWSFQWLWNQPEVSVVLSGMSTLEQVQQNILSAERSAPGILTDEELAMVARVREEYVKLAPIQCTKCQYCMPCPSGVNIPEIFELYNEARMYGSLKYLQTVYGFIKENAGAHLCTQCGQCVEHCPQQIEIIEWLAKAHELLDA